MNIVQMHITTIFFLHGDFDDKKIVHVPIIRVYSKGKITFSFQTT
jgi:hypothetical protein